MINRTYAILALAALAFVGCSKVEEFSDNPDSTLQIESVRGISSYKLMSKAVISGETLPSEEAGKGIGLFVTASDGGAYDGKDSGYTNVKYTYNGSKWSTTTPVYLSNTKGKLYGYFPYSETATDLTKIPVASSLNGTDYLYANPKEVSYSNKSVDLTMNHALARLHLTIKMGDTYLSGGNLTRIAIQSKAIDSFGTIDIKTGAVKALKDESTTGSVVFDGDGVTGIVSKTGIEKDILLVPASAAEGKKDLTLILTIDGVEAKVIFTGDKGLDIRSGVQSSATLVIEDSGIKVTGVGVGTWGDGGSQTIQVGGHTVTVKFADEQNIEKDVLMTAYKDGNVVKIEAFAKSGNVLGYTITGNATCSRTKTGSLYVFTISGISSDVTVEIGYKVAVENITLDRSSVNPAQGWIVHLLSKVSPAEATTKGVTWSSNNPDIASVDAYGNVTAIAQGEATITATAKDGSGVTASCKITVGPAIPGSLTHEFSVSATKKVHFSKGNLYADGDKALHFEANQSSFASSWDASHVSHFTWSSTVEAAVGTTNSGDYLFCDESHKVSVDDSVAIYYALSKDEWTYLFNNHSYKRASVKRVTGYVIAPDGFEGTLSDSYADDAALAANNLVFLPATGDRYGSDVSTAGGTRVLGYSVRLITESK